MNNKRNDITRALFGNIHAALCKAINNRIWMRYELDRELRNTVELKVGYVVADIIETKCFDKSYN